MANPTRRLTDQLLAASTRVAREAANGQSTTLRYGVVTDVDVDAKTLVCTVGDVILRGIPFMVSYVSPTVDDVVWLLHQGSKVVAIGTISGVFDGGDGGGGGDPIAMGDLTNVDLTGLADGDILIWNSGTGQWKPAPPPTGDGESSVHPFFLMGA